MPRPRLTQQQAEDSGAIEHHKGRFAGREKAPVPSGPIGEPPKHFDEPHQEIWHYVCSLPAPGVLTFADRLLVETLCYLVRMQRLNDISPVDRGHLRASLGSMGCTPSDRTRVSGPGKNAPSQSQTPIERLRSAAVRGKVN